MALVLLVLNLFTRFLFSFNWEGEYIHGNLYLLVYMVPLYYVLFSTVVLIILFSMETPDISVGAKYHHEKYDGTGYPYRIAGEDIPFSARIIGIADAYDAMTSRRSYRDILPQQVVRGEVEKGKGTQFDPACADITLHSLQFFHCF